MSDPNYYQPMLQNFPRINGPKVLQSFFYETEPSGETPTHQRALATKKAISVANVMLAKIQLDIMAGAQFSWRLGTPLPPIDNPTQPLGDDAQDQPKPF